MEKTVILLSFAPGNADGGLTTIEEKSLGAYAKSGHSTIAGLIKPVTGPRRADSTFSTSFPTARSASGFRIFNDNAEIAAIACGSHVIRALDGRGILSWAWRSRLSIKVCANPSTWRRMSDDTDVARGPIWRGEARRESGARSTSW